MNELAMSGVCEEGDIVLRDREREGFAGRSWCTGLRGVCQSYHRPVLHLTCVLMDSLPAIHCASLCSSPHVALCLRHWLLRLQRIKSPSLNLLPYFQSGAPSYLHNTHPSIHHDRWICSVIMSFDGLPIRFLSSFINPSIRSPSQKVKIKNHFSIFSKINSEVFSHLKDCNWHYKYTNDVQ